MAGASCELCAVGRHGRGVPAHTRFMSICWSWGGFAVQESLLLAAWGTAPPPSTRQSALGSDSGLWPGFWIGPPTRTSLFHGSLKRREFRWLVSGGSSDVPGVKISLLPPLMALRGTPGESGPPLSKAAENAFPFARARPGHLGNWPFFLTCLIRPALGEISQGDLVEVDKAKLMGRCFSEERELPMPDTPSSLWVR